MIDKLSNLAIMTLPNRKHQQLMVRDKENVWWPIAITTVPSKEFWEKLGYGLGIKIVERELNDQ